ncbi:MAG: hypothetical protein SGPRY_003015 [Prymnesium sp.]
MRSDGRDSLLGAGSSLSSGPNDRLHRVQNQVDEVRGVMQQNVDQMLENMEKTSSLESSTAELAQQALHPSLVPSIDDSHEQCYDSWKKMWWQNFKMKLAIGGGCLLFLLILAWSWGWFGGGDSRRRQLVEEMAQLLSVPLATLS